MKAVSTVMSSGSRFPLFKRREGEEQPYIPFGPFKIRLPLVHYEWEWPEALAAMFLGVACLGAGTSVATDVLGVPFELALTFALWNAIGYFLPAHLGDPVAPGWITPALPLVIAYLKQFAIGPTRTTALIALQLSVAALFLIMGLTGMGKRLVDIVPASLRAGIIIGAGIAAAINVVDVRMKLAPITISLSCLIAFYFLFGKSFRALAQKSRFWYVIRNQGIVPAQLFAIIAGPFIIRELARPTIVWGITPFRPLEVMQKYTVFGLGFPSADLFLQAIPLVLAVYIIAFGDFVLAQSIVNDASKVRPDEKIDFNANRSNLVSGLRNLMMALFAPWAPLNGPLWASASLTIAERYKWGIKTMYSIWGGFGTFRAATVIAVLIYPLICLIRPSFGIFFALTMAVQAFACGYIGINMAKNDIQKGIAVVVGTALALKGATWGLALGLILHILLEKGPDAA